MAKKTENVSLENIELKPQVIGRSYKKKSNLGRAIIIFVAFVLVIYYINDISVIVNRMLGRKSAATIEDQADNKVPNRTNNGNKEAVKVVYYEIASGLEITVDGLTLRNFTVNNNVLKFDVKNNTNNTINLSDKKYFIELFNSGKTLLERMKLDFTSLSPGVSKSYEFEIKNTFDYITITEKTTADYPSITLNDNTLTCTKGINNIVYTFLNEELTTIKHTIAENSSTNASYQTNYSDYQSKAKSYNRMAGVSATFNGTEIGYSAVFIYDLANVDSSYFDEVYFFKYKELANVVKFEMQTYGYNCS